MSASKEKAIENASEVIERFGGIRPMAKKMDVAVTTVQGWKKRDVIPAARRAKVIEAAAANDIDLGGVVSEERTPMKDVEAVEDTKKSDDDEEASEDALNDEVLVEDQESTDAAKTAPNVSGIEPLIPPADALEKRLAATEKNAITKSAWISIALVVLGLAGVVLLFWPSEKQESRLENLETNVSTIQEDMDEVKGRQSFFGTLIPDDLKTQLSSLQEQAGSALSKAQSISQDVLAEDAGTMVERAVKLEKHVSEIVGSPVLAGFIENMNGLSGNVMGQEQIDQAMSVLAGLVEQKYAQGRSDQSDISDHGRSSSHMFQDMLVAAKDNNAAVAEVFQDVPQDELKAAALLLGMTQFRSSLGRDNKPFEDDLSVLMGLVGEEDTELRSALERLAPHAQEGVLTPAGLGNEFKSIAGDAVVASLSGEDVSITDRAQARLNEVFQVEKDGELLTGTPTQSQIAKTQGFLDAGNIGAAIEAAQGIDGNAADVLAPWIQKAQTTLHAQKIRNTLGNMINMRAYGALDQSGQTIQDIVNTVAPSHMITDKESGINILVPSKVPTLPDANPID